MPTDSRGTGLMVIAFGLGVAILGLLIFSGALSWFGRLPGDIRIEKEHVRVYIPITSMLLLSLVISLVSYLLRRLF